MKYGYFKAFLLTVVLSLIMTRPSVFAQGSLTPPGAPGATMKTLDQVEARVAITNVPYIISASGSYYLTGNFSVTTEDNGIQVSANDVTLDLNGFVLNGGAVSYSGIYQPATYRNLTLLNGTLSGWQGTSQYGVLAEGTDNRIRDVMVVNGGNGLRCGENAEVSDCVVANLYSTGYLYGLAVGAGGRVMDCVVMGLWSAGGNVYGLYAERGSEVMRCISRHNQAQGSCYGIQVGTGASLADCSSTSNRAVADVYGIKAGHGAKISRCVAVDSVGGGDYVYGIYADGAAIIADCTASDIIGAHAYAIACGDGSQVSGCAMARTVSTGGSGGALDASPGSVITSCSATSNRSVGVQYGIKVPHHGTVKGCVSAGHSSQSVGAYGIYAYAGANLTESVALGISNGWTNAVGIRVESEKGVIRRCVASENTRGIWVRNRSEVRDNVVNFNACRDQDVGGIYVDGAHSIVDGNYLGGNYYIGVHTLNGASNIVTRNAFFSNNANIWNDPTTFLVPGYMERQGVWIRTNNHFLSNFAL